MKNKREILNDLKRGKGFAPTSIEKKQVNIPWVVLANVVQSGNLITFPPPSFMFFSILFCSDSQDVTLSIYFIQF